MKNVDTQLIWETYNKGSRLSGDSYMRPDSDGTEKWYKMGTKYTLHRTDTDENGETLPSIRGPWESSWWKDGKIHRLDGPAYITSREQIHYVNGRALSEDEFNNHSEVIEYRKKKEIANSLKGDRGLDKLFNAMEDM
jgi:hypothetical protein